MISHTTHTVLTISAYFLLALNASPSKADFTNKEFSESVGACLTKSIEDEFHISLQMDQVVKILSQYNFGNIRILVNNYVLPESKVFSVQPALALCLNEYVAFKKWDWDILPHILSLDCICIHIQENNKLPDTNCDRFGNAGSHSNSTHTFEEIDILLQEEGFDIWQEENEEVFYQAIMACADKFKAGLAKD